MKMLGFGVAVDPGCSMAHGRVCCCDSMDGGGLRDGSLRVQDLKTVEGAFGYLGLHCPHCPSGWTPSREV